MTKRKGELVAHLILLLWELEVADLSIAVEVSIFGCQIDL